MRASGVINSVMNLHEFNILFITYPKQRPFKVKKESFFIDAPTRAKIKLKTLGNLITMVI
jgi:hypothetical protein